MRWIPASTSAATASSAPSTVTNGAAAWRLTWRAPFGQVVEERVDEVAFGGEVPVEGRGPDAGPLSHLFDAHLRPAFGECRTGRAGNR